MIRQQVDEKDKQDRQQYLRGLRVKLFLKGETLKAVGQELGFSKSYISHILGGRRKGTEVIKFIEEMR